MRLAERYWPEEFYSFVSFVKISSTAKALKWQNNLQCNPVVESEPSHIVEKISIKYCDL